MPTEAQRIQKRPPRYRGSTGLKCETAVHHGIGIYWKRQLPRRPGCNGASVETQRERDREVLPWQHPIAGKGNLSLSFGGGKVCRWFGVMFSGWDAGGSVASIPATSGAQAGLAKGYSARCRHHRGTQ